MLKKNDTKLQKKIKKKKNEKNVILVAHWNTIFNGFFVKKKIGQKSVWEREKPTCGYKKYTNPSPREAL